MADSAAADRRWRGALIGGVGLGLAAGLVAAAFCEVGDCTRKGVEAALVGGFIGAGVGAMIGTAIPKK